MSNVLDLEAAGWRQGSVVSGVDLMEFFGEVENVDPEQKLIVISQSCDIAQNESVEPNVELLRARVIDKLIGNFTFNKNPRRLHTSLSVRTTTEEVAASLNIEISASEKASVPKHYFHELLPDGDLLWQAKEFRAFVDWLAARYSRPALPTDFNDALSKADPKDQRRKLAKKLNSKLSGVYVEINPDRDLSVGESYAVNLMGLVATDFDENQLEAKANIEQLASLMKAAGMEVATAVRSEDQVSVARIRSFNRFYFDDLSYGSSAPTPVDLEL